MKWFSLEHVEPTETDGYILIFSPCYPEDHTMRFRVIDSEFFRITTDATHWARLESPV